MRFHRAIGEIEHAIGIVRGGRIAGEILHRGVGFIARRKASMPDSEV